MEDRPQKNYQMHNENSKNWLGKAMFGLEPNEFEMPMPPSYGDVP